MNWKLATADYSFPKLEWEQALRLAHDIGMDGIDVGLFAGRSHLEPEEILSAPSKSAASVSKAIQASELQLADVFGQPGRVFEENAVNHPDGAVRKKAAEFFHRILEFAARCNAKHLTLLPGVHFASEAYDASLERCAEEWAWRAEAAKRVGIVLGVEAHIGSIAPTPAQAKRLLDMVPGLTLTLDYSHFAYQGIPGDEVEPLLPDASHFHARGACKGRLQAPLKENSIDFPRIFRTMRRLSYSGYIVIEYTWVDWLRCNEVDNISETILLRDLVRSLQADASLVAPAVDSEIERRSR